MLDGLAHGFPGEAEDDADFLVALALGNPMQHLAFARAEARCPRLSGTSDGLLHDAQEQRSIGAFGKITKIEDAVRRLDGQHAQGPPRDTFFEFSPAGIHPIVQQAR